MKETSPLHCRAATAADINNLDRLVNSAFRGEGSKKGWTTEADLLGGQRTDPEILGGLFAQPGNTFLLFEIENELVGCVYLQNRGSFAYLGMLTVRPDLQRVGLGDRILVIAEKWVFKNWKFTHIEMNVIVQRQELIAWYLRRGYENNGKMAPFPYGQEKLGIPKRQDLQFMILEKDLDPAAI